MNKKKSIKSLEYLKEQLSKSETLNSNWVIMLADLLKKYLGPESQLYETTKIWIGIPVNTNNKKEFYEIIDHAINYIESNGVYKPNSIWKLIENYDQRVVYLATAALVSFIFSIGYILGKSDWKINSHNYKINSANISGDTLSNSIQSDTMILDPK